MAAKEGFRRISTIGLRTAISGALLLLVAFFMLLWILTSPNNLVSLLMWIAMVPGFYLLLIGSLLLAAAWIGDGFADA
jgi:hypothetical protein